MHELSKAKNQIEAQFVFGQDSNFYQAMLLARFELIEDWRGPRRVSRRRFVAVDRRGRQARHEPVSGAGHRTVGVLVPTGPAKHAAASAPRDAPLTAAMRWTLRDGRDRFSSGRCRWPSPLAPRRELRRWSGRCCRTGFGCWSFASRTCRWWLSARWSTRAVGSTRVGKEGLASLTANLLTEGTEKRSAARRSTTPSTFSARSCRPVRRNDYSSVALTVLKKDLTEGFDLFATCCCDRSSPKTEFARKRDEALAELEAEEQSPGAARRARVSQDALWGWAIPQRTERVEGIRRQAHRRRRQGVLPGRRISRSARSWSPPAT